MTICVTNCFHWIGYHIVNRLIENDYQVDGLSNLSSEAEEQLSYMLGRNSSFTLFQNEHELMEKQYSEAVLLEESLPRTVQALKTYNFGEMMKQPNVINIELPLLFGEWMPMDENGVYINKDYIRFDTSEFKSEAIYIDDFIDCFMQWIVAPTLPNPISLTRNRESDPARRIGAGDLYMREDRPLEKQIASVVSHYKKIKKFKL